MVGGVLWVPLLLGATMELKSLLLWPWVGWFPFRGLKRPWSRWPRGGVNRQGLDLVGSTFLPRPLAEVCICTGTPSTNSAEDLMGAEGFLREL